MNYAIDIQQVQRTYGTGDRAVHALKSVSLQIEPARVVSLKGRSGSGKTTLLNCVGGLDKPTGGTIYVGNQDVTAMNERALTKWRKTDVSFIFQAHGLLPSLSAYENVELMLRISGTRWRERRQRALDSLEQVELGAYADHRPYELSGGQAQRVAIARAIAIRPKIILADEATGELDTATSQTILNLFRTLAKQDGTTILLATHDDIVESYAHRTVHLKDGQIDTAHTH